MSKNPASVLQINVPVRPEGYSNHYAVDWQRDPPYPYVDEDRLARNREAIRGKYKRNENS